MVAVVLGVVRAAAVESNFEFGVVCSGGCGGGFPPCAQLGQDEKKEKREACGIRGKLKSSQVVCRKMGCDVQFSFSFRLSQGLRCASVDFT